MINEYRRFWLVIIALVLSLNYVVGQNLIQGQVNISSGPAIGAQITDIKLNKIVAITSEDGSFQFTSTSTAFSISYLGYEKQTIEWNGNPITVQLIEDDGLLNQVTISENKRESAIKFATVSLEVIKPEIIDNTASPNIDETLSRLNGVQIVDQQANIRSGSGWSYGAGSRVQVLVNDMPMLSGDAGQPLWSFIPTEGVKQIEIIKGAASVIYGSSALNGVINITTIQPQDEPISKVSLSTGFYSKAKRNSLDFSSSTQSITNLSAFHAAKHKSTGYTLGINALDDNGYKMGDHDKRIRLHGGLQRSLAQKNAVVGLKSSIQQGNSSSFLLWESYDLGYTALDSNITQTNTVRLTVDPYVKWSTPNSSNNINVRYLRISNDVDNGDTLVDQSNSSNLIYGEYRNLYKWSKPAIEILSGAVGIASTTNSPLFSGSQSMRNAAAYLQLNKKWSKLIVTAGLRYEYYKLNDVTDAKPVFRSGINWEVARFSFLRASFGQGYRFPTIAESFISTSVGPITVYPNSELKAETGENLEIGFKQGFKIRNVNFVFDVAAYQMKLENMMEFTFGQWAPFVNFDSTGLGFKTLNTGKAKINGIENTLSLSYKHKQWQLQGFVGYNYSMPTSEQPDEIIGVDFVGNELSYATTSHNTTNNILKYRPKHLFKTDMMLKYNGLSFGFGATYQSQMENIDAAFTGPIIGLFVPGLVQSYNEKQTEYFILNARLGYLLKNGIHLNLIVANLLNEEYAYRPSDLGPPRSIRFQIAYNL